jgi:hypothetical protein
MRRYFPTSAILVAAGLAFAVIGAAGSGCGAAGSQNGSGDSGQGAGSPGGVGGGTGSFVGSGGSTGNQGVGGGCAGVSKTAEKAPLDMYIMFDQSGSMDELTANGNTTKWDAVVSALGTFVQQPQTAGIGIGIQYFPLASGANCSVPQCTSDAQCGAGCGPCIMPIPGFGICSGFGSSDSCAAADYAAPDVEIGLLPGNANAIIQSMASHNPLGGTPTSAALEGAIQHSFSWASGNPGHVVIVVLATDGDPTSCQTDLGVINGIAAAGVSGSPSILTFVIGVGGSVGALNGIAAAGGTQQAFMIDQDPNVEQAFLDALNAIQGQVLPCSYAIPAPAPGEMINFAQVNVTYTPGGGGMPETIPKVNSAADCPAGEKAWYYDNNANPTQIMLCPGACTIISQDTAGSVDIVLGCDTIAE